MENMLKNLERQGLPVPTKDIFGKPLVRMPCVKESELAAAVAADPEFWRELTKFLGSFDVVEICAKSANTTT